MHQLARIHNNNAKGTPKGSVNSRAKEPDPNSVIQFKNNHQFSGGDEKQTAFGRAETGNGTHYTNIGHSFGRIAVFANSPVRVQAKVAVNQPGNIYEQEADRVADIVMRMPEATLPQKCACGGSCSKCNNNGHSYEAKTLQTKKAETGSLHPSGVPDSVQEVLQSPGQPLSSATRAAMEPKFGLNFNDVRIHTDGAAESANGLGAIADKVLSSDHVNHANAGDNKVLMKEAHGAASLPSSFRVLNEPLESQGDRLDMATRSFMENRFGHNFSNVKIYNNTEANLSARKINALAYTHQNNIVFAKNQYQPRTTAGKKLLAHELTHTIQQNNNTASTAWANGAVQRFASEEHQKLGDVATGTASYNLGTAADKFELTHGDIVALSGDVFMPDELFKLAAIPGDNGKKKDTRDEIVWALQDTRIWEMRAEKKGANPFAQQQDPRFQAGGIFSGFVFSDEVKKSVFEKYQKLGAANASHFVAPLGRDKTGTSIPSPTGDSAVSKYLKYHEGAITTADKAGRAGTPVDMALASDAAAQHYLTDSFSAGHLRTPISSIREYWGNKYPLFWYNLRHKIALDTAIALVKGQTIITNNRAYKEILGAVEAMAPTLPAVTLGDLIGSVYHDVDNESGLNIKGGGKVFGDKNLDTATEKLAVDAIKASNNDINKAYEHGKTTATAVPDKNLFNNVRKAGGGSSTQYAAELAMPQPDKTEPSQNWKASSINALWDQKFLGKKGDTVGTVISKRVQDGSIAIQLTALADRFPPDQNVPIVNIQLHPQAAYLTGFVKKLQADPKAGVLDIVNWIPHDMWTGDAEGDVVQDLKSKGDAGDKKENLSGMSHEQRIKFVQEFLADGKPGWLLSGSPDAYDKLITIFENTGTKERNKVYQEIEGRAWNGNVKASDEFSFKIRIRDKDSYKDVMDQTRVAKFKKAMSGK